MGNLFPSPEARLVDLTTGEDVTNGEPGELWIRGPQVMKGYFGPQHETEPMLGADGWLHTGDIARVDADGNWFIVDRVKELIKDKGYQVAPHKKLRVVEFIDAVPKAASGKLPRRELRHRET